MFSAASFTKISDMKTAQMPICGWRDKKDVVHIDDGKIFTCEKGKCLLIFSHIDGP